MTVAFPTRYQLENLVQKLRTPIDSKRLIKDIMRERSVQWEGSVRGYSPFKRAVL